MVQSVELALDPDADPTRVRSPAIDGAVQRTLHVHQHLHHRPVGMVSKIPMRSLNGLGGNVLSRAGHFGEYEVQNTEALDGNLICDDPLRIPAVEEISACLLHSIVPSQVGQALRCTIYFDVMGYWS